MSIFDYRKVKNVYDLYDLLVVVVALQTVTVALTFINFFITLFR